MAIFDFPSFTPSFSPSKSLFVLPANQKLDISAVNNSQSVIVNPGKIWLVRYVFKFIEMDDALALRALLNRLDGSIHKTRLRDPKYVTRGSWSGTPVVDGNGIYGRALPIRGMASNQVIARACDRFRIFEQLYELVEDAITDGNGRCTLQLANDIRQPVNDNDPLITDTAGLTALCRWTKPEQIEQLMGNKRLYRDVSFDFMEYV